MKAVNMDGLHFGNLHVLKKAGVRKGHTYWLCQCRCGNIVEVEGGNLRSGHTTSCGHCERYEAIDEITMRCRLPTGKSFIFDAADLPLVKEHKWSIEDSGYVQTMVKGKHIRLHRLLLGFPDSHIDHINGERSDNRKSNLRLCTNQENHWNTKTPTNNTSGYKGVTLDKRQGRYAAYITVSGRHKFLGYYDTAWEAARKYDEAASFYFGEFARRNFEGEEVINIGSSEILEVAV